MRKQLIYATPFLFVGAALAIDNDYDGLDDDFVFPPGPSPVEGSAIAILDISGTDQQYAPWLSELGYSYTLIPLDSDYNTLRNYSLVLLPYSHGEECCYETMASHASDYHRYVQEGGCLYVGQPNPFKAPPKITWVPYLLELSPWYTLPPCDRYITNPEHCITEGLYPFDLAPAGDTVIQMGPEWEVLVRQVATQDPGVFTASFGKGRIVVELGAPGGICTQTIAGFQRYLECCLPGPISIEENTWGSVKAKYR